MATKLAPGSVETLEVVSRPNTCRLRVFSVIPEGSGVMYAIRQVASLNQAGLEVATFRLRSRTSITSLAKEYRRLRSEVQSFRPHLMHAHYGTITSFLCAISSPVPLVITFRGSDLNGDPDVNMVRSRMGQLLSQLSSLRADGMICVSSRLRDRLWWRHDGVTVIPTGVNLDLFCPQPKDQARWLLGWEQGARIVLFSGAHRPRTKGLDLVKDAVEIAKRSVNNIQLKTLDGSISPDLMPVYLNAADCVALASKNEGSPNLVKEAMACNLPVISTDIGDVAERLRGVFPSRVVSRDAVEFGKAIADVLLQNRRSNGREQIAHYSESQVANLIQSVYVDTLEKNGK